MYQTTQNFNILFAQQMARRSGGREEGLGGSGAGRGVHRGRIRNIQGTVYCYASVRDIISSLQMTGLEAPCILASTPHPSVIPILNGLYSVYTQHLKQLMIISHYKRQPKKIFCVMYRYITTQFRKNYIFGPIFLFKITNCVPFLLCLGAASVRLRPREGGVPASDPPAGGPPLP